VNRRRKQETENSPVCLILISALERMRKGLLVSFVFLSEPRQGADRASPPRRDIDSRGSHTRRTNRWRFLSAPGATAEDLTSASGSSHQTPGEVPQKVPGLLPNEMGLPFLLLLLFLAEWRTLPVASEQK